MPAQSPDYFEHDADIGIIGRGATVEQAFEAAARAVLALSQIGYVSQRLQ